MFHVKHFCPIGAKSLTWPRTAARSNLREAAAPRSRAHCRKAALDRKLVIAALEVLLERLGLDVALEFVARDVDAPTDTMVPDACVNHVPTMTGGVGRDELKRFYKYHFVKATPPDIEIIPVSRTVGTDTIVDEMVAKFKRPDK
jgi:hypothetical protein